MIDDAFALADDNYNPKAHPETILVFGGEDEGGVRNDAWNFSNHTGNKWILDFGNGTVQEMYAGADSPVSYVSLRTARVEEEGLEHVAGLGMAAEGAGAAGLFNQAEKAQQRHAKAKAAEATLTSEQLAILESEGITTIRDLAEASKEQILNLRGGGTGEGWEMYRGGPFRYICPWKKRAMQIMEQCVLKEAIPYEMEIDARLGMLEVVYGTNPPTPEVSADVLLGDVDGCNPDELEPEEEALKGLLELEEEKEEKRWEQRLLLDGEVSVTCKIIPEARSYASSVVMGNKMYVIGGFSKENTYLDDVWYRDDLFPNVKLETELNTGYDLEHATRIYYSSNNKEGVLFEYRMELLYGALSLEALQEELLAQTEDGENPACLVENPPPYCLYNLPDDDGIFKKYIGIGHVKRIVRNWTISSQLPGYLQDVSSRGER